MHDAQHTTSAEARQAFEELAWMLGNGFLVSLYVYADESGLHDSSKVMIISGWGASCKQWKKFAGQWQRKLNESHAPYLHMRELAAYERETKRDSPFYLWSDKKSRAFVGRMIPVIRDNAVFGLTCAVTRDGYDALSSGWRQQYPHPYTLAFRLFFEELLKIIKGETKLGKFLSDKDKCHLLFDRQDEHGEAALVAFKNLKENKDDGERYGKMVYGHSRGDGADLPLQGADLLASRFYKRYLTESEQNKPIEHNGWDALLQAKGNLFVTLLQKAECDDFIQRVERRRRSAQNATGSTGI